MFPAIFINPTVALTLSTMVGVFVHDMKIDQFTTTLLAAPAIAVAYEGSIVAIKMTDPHTHPETVSVSQLGRTMSNKNPRLQPRNDDKKYNLEKKVMKGRHPFDNYSLPAIS